MRRRAKQRTDQAREAIVSAAERAKPRLRGVSHQYAFFASLATGGALVAMAPGATARLAAAVYAACTSSLFGASALYHRVDWRPAARRWMRRLDHSTIFLMIAGTYTPFCLLVLDGTLATVMLVVVWGGTAAAITLKFAWVDAPKWLAAAIAISLGWVAVIVFPQLIDGIGWDGTTLTLAGGVCYTIGGLVYALRRPNPLPHVFGYHEIFHVLVIAAVALQYSVVSFWLVHPV